MAAIAVIAIGVLVYEFYNSFLIEVPNKHMAVLVHKTGKDLDNSESLAPSEEYKGVQPVVLTEGRYYYNPYNWAWTVVPQIEIPAGKLGVRIRLYGENLPTGELIAFKESQKGIVPEVLYPGRYPSMPNWSSIRPPRKPRTASTTVMPRSSNCTIR